MSTSFKGNVMTVIAGIAWGLSGVSGQYLMAHGFSAIRFNQYSFTNFRCRPPSLCLSV